jgi:hypothetical protein
MTTTDMHVVRVKDLQAGDVLVGTQQTVVGVWQRAHLPSSKRQVNVRYGNGAIVSKTWSASTTIAVARTRQAAQP